VSTVFSLTAPQYYGTRLAELARLFIFSKSGTNLRAGDLQQEESKTQ